LKIGIVIPARLESERLPGKVLKDFLGKPMIEHVWRRAQLIRPKVETVILTDSNEIIKTCNKFGARTLLTSKKHLNGLSRVGEASSIIKWDAYIVLQADEILVVPSSLEQLHKSMLANKEYPFFNLVSHLFGIKELNDQNIVKCIFRSDKTIISIMRKVGSIAPEKSQLEFTSKICGIYGVTSEALSRLIEIGPSKFETSESIEQMRVIEAGMNILGVETDYNYLSVNTLDEAQEATRILENDNLQKKILNLIYNYEE